MGKKIAALLLMGALLVSLSACGGGTRVTLPSLDASEGSSVPAKEVESGSYEDSLEGLCQYMEDSGAVIRTPDNEVSSGAVNLSFTDDMAVQEIGAEKGCRYRFTYNGSTVQVEFYQFDLENLGDKGKECLDSVKEKGYFTVLETQVQAEISDSGKYVMIYTDGKTDEANQAQKERVTERFAAFKG